MNAEKAIRVLVVEDDRAVRSFLARALETGGYEPVLAQTGGEALTVLRDDAPVQVALIDGLLPDMHGMQLAQAVVDGNLADQLAICFVTGGITESSPPQAGVAVLSKPMRLKELLAMVGDLLRWRDGGGSQAEDRRAALARFEHAFLVGP